MNDNVQKLIDAGVLNVTDRNQLPQDLVDKLNALPDEHVTLLTNLKSQISPELLNTYKDFIIG